MRKKDKVETAVPTTRQLDWVFMIFIIDMPAGIATVVYMNTDEGEAFQSVSRGEASTPGLTHGPAGFLWPQLYSGQHSAMVAKALVTCGPAGWQDGMLGLKLCFLGIIHIFAINN